MEKTEQRVEAEVGHVLRDWVAVAQPVFDRFQIPIAELIPRESVGRVDRVLEREVFDAGADLLCRDGKTGKYPAVFEVLARLEHSRSPRRPGPRRAQDESGGVPQLVAEAPVTLDAALIEAH